MVSRETQRPWEVLFYTLAYSGLLIFTIGIIWKPYQALLFFIGGLLLWTFANWTKNQIFVGAQSIMLVASFMRLFGFTDIPLVTPAVITFLTAVVLTNMLVRRDFSINSPQHLIGVGATLGLILGVVFAQTLYGNILFAIGGGLMVWYAETVGSTPFVTLNIIFPSSVLWEIGKYFLNLK